ncbi:endonuclease domain-containing protein [Roseateles chitosanitabidus]|jgi:very-short-patch-repair endonuclease|uniref:endonuclease domain-containing protein n=1 Tax=Roseateles chitosanitabidus TaxID=65048 RepID=UPI00083282EB|nr:endonuclease domain-containing protein [Roseateles chitosanitabidus]
MNAPNRPSQDPKINARRLRSAATDAERSLWSCLRDRRLDGHKFRRQHPVNRYIADFVCLEARLIVELDGGQHFDPAGAAADAARTAKMEALGFHVMRFSNLEVLHQREAVVSVILGWLTSGDRGRPSPQPSPAEREREP